MAKALSGDLIDEALDNSKVFVAVEADRIAGFAKLIEMPRPRTQLDLLYVDPDFSRRGVARDLICAVEEAARSHAPVEIWVDASLSAVRVFEALGYQFREEYLEELGGLFYENAWFSKRL